MKVLAFIVLTSHPRPWGSAGGAVRNSQSLLRARRTAFRCSGMRALQARGQRADALKRYASP